MHSRFGALNPWPARLLLSLLLLLILYGMAQDQAPVPANTGNVAEDRADVLLYKKIVARVRSGDDYHEAAAEAQREGGYPLRPFVTMRLPTLAWLHAALPDSGTAAILLDLLLLTVLAAWAMRLRKEGLTPARIAIGLLLILSGSLILRLPELLVWHEGWAALLIALSLALRADGKIGLAVAAGLAAVMIRELAVLYPLVMAGAAMLERRWREATAWSFVLGCFVAFLAWHASRVMAVTMAGDAASQGWSAVGGWRFVVTMLHFTGPLRSLPYWTGAVLLPLALIGWAGWRSATGARGALVLAAFILLFSVAGRPDNFYWAFLIAPLVPLGLLFAPQAMADIVRSALDSQPSSRHGAEHGRAQNPPHHRRRHSGL